MSDDQTFKLQSRDILPVLGRVSVQQRRGNEGSENHAPPALVVVGLPAAEAILLSLCCNPREKPLWDLHSLYFLERQS